MVARLEIGRLAALVAISDTGSINGAAKVLGRSQAAVSEQLRELERSCGQTLVARSPRGAVLTDPGARLETRARQILDLHDTALREMAVPSSAPPVRIGVADDFAGLVLEAIAEMPGGAPLISLTCAPTPDLQAQHDQGAFDLFVEAYVPTSPKRGTISLFWIVPPRCTEPKTLPLIAGHPRGPEHEMISRYAAEVTHRRVIRCSSSVAVIAAVRAGLGQAVIAETALREEDRDLVREGLRLPRLALRIVSGGTETKAIKAVGAAIAAGIADQK